MATSTEDSSQGFVLDRTPIKEKTSCQNIDADNSAIDEMTVEASEVLGGSNPAPKTFARMCAVCEDKTSKYCCPKCGIRTCSLDCVHSHKTTTGCDGIRDKTAFIAMNKFSDLDLLSDYRFLEESARVVDGAIRNQVVKPHRIESLPPNLVNLQKFAWNKYRIRHQFLPQMFSRRRLNRTSIKKGQIHWTLQVNIPQGDSEIVRHDIAASRNLKHIIKEDILGSLTALDKEKLAALVNASLVELYVFMKAVGRPSNDDRFYPVDMDLTLEENLRGKAILEFPLLFLVTGDHKDAFPPVPEDDENNQPNNKDSRQRKRGGAGTGQSQHEVPSFFLDGGDEEDDDDFNENKAHFA